MMTARVRTAGAYASGWVVDSATLMCAALLIASSPSPLRGSGRPHCIVAGATHLGSIFVLK